MDRTEHQLHVQQQQQQQQQQRHHQGQQAPAVVILQQPVIVGNGTFSRGVPFLRRGLKLNNGTKIGPRSMIWLGVIGGVLVLIGIPLMAGTSVFVGILLLLLGGVLLAVCFKFCQKAKQDYDALPQDHPDRVKYSSLVYTSRQGGRTVLPYQFVPGTQVITSPATLQDGRLVVNSQLPPGFQIIDSSSACQNESASHGNIDLSQYHVPMSTSPQCTVSPEDDKPPSYDEVCRDMANK